MRALALFEPIACQQSVMNWQFRIDVGGTFTDCIGISPEGSMHTAKVLSSGVVPGVLTVIADRVVEDPQRSGEVDECWRGAQLRVIGRELPAAAHTSRVVAFDGVRGRFTLETPLPVATGEHLEYELTTGEDAPLLAIRRILRLRLDEPVPAVDIRLGTTRGTNALLERRGARTALVTTRGFADALSIGDQARPRLFDLAIRKPEMLFERVLEIDERVAADGSVLVELDENRVREALEELRREGIESLAICLVNACSAPEHEQRIARIAAATGFEEISVSSLVSPVMKLIPRGETTVVNAYLNPVLRSYIERLSAPLQTSGTSKLRLMTSRGGLVSPERFLGKDSILSGPAGGVIAFSRLAQRAGFASSIGFDMGGTSTDVARFDGKYLYDHEAVKAGVRLATPMLSIETVAAGGGSLCHFDGVRLLVGPRSAGASPGPACYGRGGPLTVTDCNLAVGRLLPEEFPFPLDTTAVQERLEELVEEIAASPLGVRYTPRSLAAGFLEIANANIVRAIRRVSIARGFDPADDALVVFGGAGGQHACAIADALDMRSIYVHPHAGLLSAVGMGLADVTQKVERPVHRPYSPETLADLALLFEEMDRQARAAVLAEGIPESEILPPRHSLDLRYRGVEGVLTVDCPPDGNDRAEFERLHRLRYGYLHHDRELEVVSARTEVVGRLPETAPESADVRRTLPDNKRAGETASVEKASTQRQPPQTSPLYCGGEIRPAAVWRREDLHPGQVIAGPAIVCEPTSTLVVETGWTARVTPLGELILKRTDSGTAARRRAAVAATTDAQSVTIDPVTLEIFNNQLASIAEQMGATLQLTAQSTNVKERLDFSCAIFDAGGGLVVNAPHVPVHLGAMSETIRRLIADHPNMQPGDVFLTNDPYRGGSHLPDVTVITPVHTGEGDLLFFTASRAHHAEIGGMTPGSMPPFSRTLAEEGVLLRSFRIVAAGESRRKELLEQLTARRWPSRSPEDNLADVDAQIAANRMGAELLLGLIRRSGRGLVESAMHRIQEAAAEKMRLALRSLPDGRYSMTDHLDDDSPVAVTISIKGDAATVDFTGTGPVLPTNLNANRAIVTAAVMFVFRCLIAEEIPLNGGVLEPVEIVLPECLLNPPAADDPDDCPAMVGGNVETSQRVVDVLLGALSLAAASQGTMNNLTFGDGQFGYYETICGGSGATADADGASAVHTHMTNTRLTDVEILERRYPVRVREFSIRRNSGGAGSRRGGDGIVRSLEFLRPLKVSMLSQRRGSHRPFGLRGGLPGAAGVNRLHRTTGEVVNLGGAFQIDVQPGDILTIETPGGGGWGAP